MENSNNELSFIERTAKVVSQVISFLFHPMFMPLLGVYLIFNSGSYLSLMPFAAKRAIYIIVFLSTCVLPISLLPLLYQLKVIKSFSMESSRERLWPIVITAVFTILGMLLLKKMGLTGLLPKFILSMIITLIVAGLVSFFWKISLHMIGVGGVTGALLFLGLRFNLVIIPFLSLFVLMAGVTASSRLKLGAHAPLQVYVGYLSGIVIVFSSLFFL